MTTVMLHPVALESAATATHGGNSIVLVAVILFMLVFVALSRVLRRVTAVLANLIGSAGSLVTLLVALFGAGALLLATVITVAMVG